MKATVLYAAPLIRISKFRSTLRIAAKRDTLSSDGEFNPASYRWSIEGETSSSLAARRTDSPFFLRSARSLLENSIELFKSVTSSQYECTQERIRCQVFLAHTWAREGMYPICTTLEGGCNET